MLLTWMAYATLIGAAVSVAALAVERIVAIWNGARRVVWMVALLAAVVLPAALAFRVGGAVAPAPRMGDVERVNIDPSIWSARGASKGMQHSASAMLTQQVARVNGSIPAAWAIASALLFCLFLRADWMLRGRRAEWRRGEVEGHAVLIARDVGPAVVGALRSRIVFPEWAFGLESHERMLMLKHECEHVAARDPLTLLLAGLAVICFPWNAGLWFIAKRLRLAVEIDCDARVLRAVNRPREYGMLLLAVGSRNVSLLPYAASLVERRPLLERRIRAMTSIRPTRPIFASVLLGLVAVAATTVVAQAPRPEPLVIGVAEPTSVQRETTASDTAPTSDRASAGRVDSAQARTTIEPTATAAPIDSAADDLLRRANLRVTLDALAPRITPSASPIAAVAAPAEAAGDIPLPVIREWIAKYHPDIVSGQAAAALVTIIVDANDAYVSSTTDAAQVNPAGKIPVDSIAQIEVLKGTAAAALYGKRAENGVIVVTTKSGNANATTSKMETATRRDGVFRQYVDGKEVNVLSNVLRNANSKQIVDGSPLYVIDGVVVESPDPIARPSDQLDKLGIPSDGIQAVQVLRVRAGQIGPNALSVVVVKLKA